MKKLSYFIATFVFLSFFNSAFGAEFLPERPYYGPLLYQALKSDQTDSEKIKGILSQVLSRQRTIDYTEARKILFGQIHLLSQRGPDGEIKYSLRDVYCSKVLNSEDFAPGKGPGPNKIPDVRVLNTEHTWPQSKFSTRFSEKLQKGDLHILYPVSPRANTSRSNHPFSYVSTVKSTPCTPSKLGLSSRGRQTFFEPPDEHKGNAARAIFYFSVRYQMELDEDQESTLKEWNEIDPVDEFENFRNEQIFQAQGNRNPFIDHPELANLIQNF